MASTKASGSFHRDIRPSELFNQDVFKRGSWTDLSSGRMVESKVVDREHSSKAKE